MKWYCSEDLRLFDSRGYCPIHGIELKPVTREIVKEIESRKKYAKEIEIREEAYFHPLTGEPLKWYYVTDEGEYEFFSHPGHHPKYGVPLKPVTPEVMGKYELILTSRYDQERKEREKKRQDALVREKERQRVAYLNKYIDWSVKKVQGRKNFLPIIAVDLSARTLDEDLGAENSIRDEISVLGFDACNNFFKPTFIQEGHLLDLYAGRTEILRDLQVNKLVDYIILGQKTKRFFQHERLKDMISCKADLGYRIINASGKLVKSGTTSATGIGIDEPAAEKKANDLLAKQISEILVSF